MSMSSSRPKHVLILCHPDEHSFNAAVAERYERTIRSLGHEVVVRDLYRMHFDPVLKASERPTAADFTLSADVAAELELIQGAAAFVLVYPLWYGMPPAMLKGYVERVLGAGFPFGALRMQMPNPLLSGRRLLSFTSSGTTRAWLDEQGAALSLRNLFDDYLRHGFSLESTDHVHFASIVEGIQPRVVEEHLFEVEQTARKLASLLPRNG
ncbi:NAD(P)H-dependent oxidoreductase [Sphingomonas fennica]|uniref:NAD(P)H dehydrogenase n=1 Tax=Edaphosphingomonas fennica TaxID=114404 RepID=A0A2T4HYF2_9SPHN|nr:NAD(P)H-dependent oxidoreductase [Sphingomonas fennica]PTD21112.1 NAD(P)H dehydrogenase [Sphingomonas fennica]